MRTDDTYWVLLTPFSIGMIASDYWGSYAREVLLD
ncbi:hypothetical protein FGU63_17985 (plasmid) [Edwardsiella ictaluri]|nr:hypothetical protein FGU63_17985 [Edwardsiella ictaluri]